MTYRMPARGWRVLACVWIVVACVVVAHSLPDILWYIDLDRCLDASRRWLSGGDPYAVAGFFYSPVAVILFAPLSLLPTVLVETGWAVAHIALAAGSAWALTPFLTPLDRVVAVTAVTVMPAVLADTILGNVTVPLVVAMVLATRRDGFRWGVLLGIALAAFAKPMLVPILLWCAVFHRRSAAGALAGAGAVAVFALLATGPEVWGSFFAALRAATTMSYDFVGNVGLSARSPSLAVVATVLSLLLLVIVLRWRDRQTSLAFASAVSIIAAPYTGIYAGASLLTAAPSYPQAHPGRAFIVAWIAILLPFAAAPAAIAIFIAILVDPGRLARFAHRPTSAP